MEEYENYEGIGLTKNEAKVYETLIKFGKLGAGEISRESGVSYSKIYNVLDSLINKNLASVIPEKSKKFIPGSPEALIELIEKKQNKLEKSKEKAKKGKDIKTLARYDKETEKNVKKYLKSNKNIKEIENKGIAMSILDDEQVMIALIKSNVTLLIKDFAFTKIMK